MELTKKSVLKLCREMNLYSTPELNDRLYLHQKGIVKIENLDEYTGVRVLWLQQNGIEAIENLEHLQQLRHLYLNENMIQRINGAQSLRTLTELDTLNLEKNCVKHIAMDDLSHLHKLNTLNVAHNRLSTVESVRGLLHCPSLCVLDLRNNSLEVTREFVEEIVGRMRNLRVLYLMSSVHGSNENTISEQLQCCYRKLVIAKCANLRHLDDRPVFEEERRCCDAWLLGGIEAERRQRQQIRNEKEAKQQANHEALHQLVQDAKNQQQAIATTQNNRQQAAEQDDDDEVDDESISSAGDIDDDDDHKK